MALITKNDVIKIAALSAIELETHEIDRLTIDLQALIEYTAQLSNVPMDHLEETPRATNVFRDDIVSPHQSERAVRAQLVREQAPEMDGTSFVVPPIIDNH